LFSSLGIIRFHFPPQLQTKKGNDTMSERSSLIRGLKAWDFLLCERSLMPASLGQYLPVARDLLPDRLSAVCM
jgi:hypothetical protein